MAGRGSGSAPHRAWEHGAALLVVAAIVAVFFSPYLIRGKIFIAGDALFSYLPWSAYAPEGFRPKNSLITDPVNANYAGPYNAQLKSGGLRQWNPLILGGLPSTGVTAMGGGAPGRYYPVKLLLHRWLPTLDAFMWLLIVHVFLSGAFLYLYLREIGAGLEGGLFGAVAFMLNGYAMVWLEFESVAAVSAYLPLLLLVMERYRRRPALYGLLGAPVFGVIVLSGQMQYVVYVALLALFYAAFLLVRSWNERRDPRELRAVFLACCATFALGALVGAVELLPSLDLIRQSSRLPRAFAYATFFETLGRVPWRYFVTLLFPDFFGSPVVGFNLLPRLPTQEYMNYNELCVYLGVPTLFALLALPLRPGRRAAFFLASLVLLVPLLAGTALYYPLYLLVPGMDKMNPTRLIFLFVFVAAVAAALGLDALPGLSRRRRVLFSVLAGSLLAIMAALAAAAGASRGLTVWFNSEALRDAGNSGLLASLLQLRAPSSPVIYRPLLLAAAGLVLVCAYAWLRAPLARRATLALLVTLLAIDLGRFGWGYNAMVDPQLVYPATPAVDFLSRQPGPFRVVFDGRHRFLANSLAPFGIEDIGGYSSFYPERVGRLLSFVEFGQRSLEGARFDRWVFLANIGSPLLDLLNVRYVLTDSSVKVGNPRFRPVFRGEVAIYENSSALPRAFAVHRARVVPDAAAALRLLGSEGFPMGGEVLLEREPDAAFLADVAGSAGGDRVEVVRYELDRVEVSASMGGAGWLVLADAWYPGWRAEVDGRPATVERADVFCRAVPLSAGEHRVVFTYAAPAFRAGLAITVTTLALLSLGMVRERRRARGAA